MLRSAHPTLKANGDDLPLSLTAVLTSDGTHCRIRSTSDQTTFDASLLLVVPSPPELACARLSPFTVLILGCLLFQMTSIISFLLPPCNRYFLRTDLDVNCLILRVFVEWRYPLKIPKGPGWPSHSGSARPPLARIFNDGSALRRPSHQRSF